ncbi:hypothetical protein [Rhodococcus sp. NPDC003348]
MNETTDAEVVAAQALTVPGVCELHGGMFGEVATYLPGRRLLGVRVTDTECAVHVVVAYPHNVVEVAQAVHRVVEPLVAVPVTVTVEDVALPPVSTGTARTRSAITPPERTPR